MRGRKIEAAFSFFSARNKKRIPEWGDEKMFLSSFLKRTDKYKKRIPEWGDEKLEAPTNNCKGIDKKRIPEWGDEKSLIPMLTQPQNQ